MSDDLNQNVSQLDEIRKKTISSLGSGFSEFIKSNPNYILVSKNKMGDNLSFTGSMTLDSFGKTIKFAHQMQLFSHMVETDDHGKQRLIRDAGMLNDLTQREVNYKREESLVKYLLDDSRKFPPILAVITADWVDPKDPENSIYDKKYWDDSRVPAAKFDSCEFIPLTEDLGLLNISKDYFIYALDGQHRLLGVKGLQTLADKGSITFGKKNQDLSTVTGIDDYPVSNINRILNEKISIEFVVGVKKDETRSEAKERVRTLFVDINDKAQKLSKAAGAALKDNGYNKVAKKVLEMDNFLAKEIDKEGSGEPVKVTNLQATNPTDTSPEFTTLDILVHMAENLIQEPAWKSNSKIKLSKQEAEEKVEKHSETFAKFIEKMSKLECLDQFMNTTDMKASNFRIYNQKKTADKSFGVGNILFRRVGQITFAKAVGDLMNDPENPMDLDKIFKKVYIFEKKGGFEKLDQPSSIFYSILFDPNKFRMIVSGSNIKLASDLLRYVLFQPFTDDKRENLRQDLIDKRRMRSINKIRDYKGDNIDFTEEENDSNKKIYNCDLKLPETV